jgi:replicative DNA helicase
VSESTVLSALLNDKQIHHLLQSDTESLFVTHGDVWKFIKDYYSMNNTVPPAALVIDAFPDFIPENPTSLGATQHHLEQLRKEHLDRELRSALRNAATLIQDGQADAALQHLMNEVRNLNKEISVVKDINAVDTDSAVSYLKEMIDNRSRAHGVKTGIDQLDLCFPAGIRGGQLGIVMAYPSIGKSYISLYILAQAWKQGFTPMIVSLEMSEEEVRNRLYTILGKTRWSLRRLSSGDVDIEEFERWHHMTFDGKQPFYIISSDSFGGEVTPETIRAKMNQYKPDIVACDYMQLMSPNDSGNGSEVVRMKNLSRELKMLAMSEKIPILAISSATPTDASDMSSVPTLGQTAWSRQIAYDADFVLAMGRDLNDDVMQVVGRKNREGMLPDFLLQVDFDKGLFIYKAFDDV